MEEKYALTLENVTMAYDIKPVIFDISMKVPSGTSVAIIGPNGAGKSTLLKGLVGLAKPITGQIHYDDQPLKSKRSQIAYVPQKDSVDWNFPATVFDVVMMGRYAKLGYFKRPNKLDKQKVIEALETVDMLEFRNRQIDELSGGQKQRVFLARALVSEAEIFLLDEPFQGVDARSEQTIAAVLKKLETAGKTLIVVHHQLSTVKEYFSMVALLNVQLVAFGPTEEVFTATNIKNTFQK